MANKIEYGLRKFVVFPLIEGTNGAITYGDPVSLPGIQSMTMDPQGDETSIYADDTLYFSHYSSTGYKGSIQFVTKSDLIGKTLFGDVETEDGGLLELSDAKPLRFGAAFQCAGDEKNVRHKMYNVTFSRGSTEHKTMEDKIEAATYSCDFTAIPVELADGHLASKGRFVEGSAGYDDAFDTLTLPTIKTDTGA